MLQAADGLIDIRQQTDRSKSLDLNVAKGDVAGVSLKANEAWDVGRAREAATVVRIIELSDLHTVQLHGESLSLDPDFVGVPLADW
jgi:hypothetical protein